MECASPPATCGVAPFDSDVDRGTPVARGDSRSAPGKTAPTPPPSSPMGFGLSVTDHQNRPPPNRARITGNAGTHRFIVVSSRARTRRCTAPPRSPRIMAGTRARIQPGTGIAKPNARSCHHGIHSLAELRWKTERLEASLHCSSPDDGAAGGGCPAHHGHHLPGTDREPNQEA